MFKPFMILLTTIALSAGVHAQESEPSSARKNYVAKDAVLKILEEREIPCLVSGVIKKNHVREGSLLRDGQAVMEIDDAMVKLEIDKLKKERDIAAKEASTTVELQFKKRSIEVAEAELGRALRSNQRQPGAVARSEIDQLTLMVQRAIAERETTEFQIKVRGMQTEVKKMEVSIGEKKLNDHKINSPITGMVVEILKKQGEWVQASEPVAKLIRLDKLKTEIKVPASVALDRLVGCKGTFKPNLKSLGGKDYPAIVTFVYPEANPVNASVRVWVEIENTNLDLVPGLTGKLEITRSSSATEKSADKATADQIGAVSNR